MNALMEQAGERLNLKLHGAGPGGAVKVCGPADIEGTGTVCVCCAVCAYVVCMVCVRVRSVSVRPSGPRRFRPCVCMCV